MPVTGQMPHTPTVSFALDMNIIGQTLAEIFNHGGKMKTTGHLLFLNQIFGECGLPPKKPDAYPR